MAAINSKIMLPISPPLRDKSIGVDAIVLPKTSDRNFLLNRQSAPLVSERKYTIKEACGKMGVGETTLRAIIKAGGIAVLTIGGKHLLLERDVENYLKAHYGAIREVKVETSRLAPLPDNIANSDLIKKKTG